MALLDQAPSPTLNSRQLVIPIPVFPHHQIRLLHRQCNGIHFYQFTVKLAKTTKTEILKLMKSTLQKAWLLPMLICVASLINISIVKAAVIVYFEQDGDNVTASWSGTLNIPTTSVATRDDSAAVVTIGDTQNLYHLSNGSGAGYYLAELGAASASGLLTYNVGPEPGDPTISFGFALGALAWNDIHISGGTVGAVTQLTFDPSRDKIRFLSGLSLGDLNADAFSNSLAWTATTTNDTISFTTGPVPSVPEPSSLLLVGAGTLTFLARRKRA